MAEHIVAVFRTSDEASAAVADLEKAGIPSSAIRHYASGDSAQQEAGTTTRTSTHTSGGFWAWLFGEQSETTHSTYAGDADLYDRRAAAGNVVVSVTVDDDSKIHQAIAALEAHHPVEMDESADEVDEAQHPGAAPLPANATAGREFSNAEVAQPGSQDTAPATPVGAGSGRVGSTDEAGSGPTPNPTGSASSGQTDQASGHEEVVPLSEEQLEIGKRTVDRGTTRVRRYVVEKPVEESITLRGEKVTVERRHPIETTAAPGGGAFEERVIEVRETAEEPVVSKTAHVVEEVVVGRETTERTEHVQDTVRREDVEVTNGREDGKR